jgi:hypothetical protein
MRSLPTLQFWAVRAEIARWNAGTSNRASNFVLTESLTLSQSESAHSNCSSEARPAPQSGLARWKAELHRPEGFTPAEP